MGLNIPNLQGLVSAASPSLLNQLGAMVRAQDKFNRDLVTASTSLSSSNSGDLSLGTANGLSLSGQVLSLATAVAGGANGALLGTDKTKLNNTTNVNSGDVTIAAFGSTPNASGASLSTQALTIQPADRTNPGGVSIADQTWAGRKTFFDGIALTSGTPNAVVGKATLPGGSPNSVTISTTAVTTNSFIFLSRNTIVGTAGTITPGSIVSGTSFKITSSTTETSVVNWWVAS